ncbi:hypothetical protein FB451DRAFT_1514181 [Mycena latifolia]|nr:hypothetical protein FB451DRAFT_1514181 [Mycena latifolia]
MSSRTHLDVLSLRIGTHGPKPFYKIPRKTTAGPLGWECITYWEFGRNIDAVAAHFSTRLQHSGVPDGAVVGLWLPGSSYSDIVHFYALSKGGYVPDMISTALTDPATVLELLKESNAKALFHVAGSALPNGWGMPVYSPLTDLENIEGDDSDLPVARLYKPDDVALIQYTSGSTGTKPKTVVCSHKWISSSVYDSWDAIWNPPGEGELQDVFNLPGNINHPSGFHALCVGINLGGAFIQPSSPRFSSDELVQLALHGGLNRLLTLAPFFVPLIMAAQTQLKSGDDTILRVLQNMRSIVYGAMPMPPIYENWAFENNLPIMNMLGTTETGSLLHSIPGKHPRHMIVFSGLALDFEPQARRSDTGEQLFKLVVLPTSGNIPHASLCNQEGKFYPGDLFTRNEDGTWAHRGREGDWILIGRGCLCDTKHGTSFIGLNLTIEEYIRSTCSDLIEEFVVVGTHRPKIALLAETAQPDSTRDNVKEAIIARMEPFDQRRYVWERLSMKNIVFVPRGALPHTAKGNIRRNVAEKLFEKELNAVYASMPAH